MSDEDFINFCAVGIIDDWSGEWHTATICTAITNALLDLQRRGRCVFEQPDDKEYTTQTDFLMKFKGEQKVKAKKSSPMTSTQHVQLFRKMAGL